MKQIFSYKIKEFIIGTTKGRPMLILLSPVLYYNVQTEFSFGTSESDGTPALISRRHCPLSDHFILR